MSSQPESLLTARIRRKLQQRFPGSWWVKTDGNSKKGTPDLLGCVDGLFVAIEVKLPSNAGGATKLQLAVQDEIARAGGCVATVTDAHQAVQAVEEALAAPDAAPA